MKPTVGSVCAYVLSVESPDAFEGNNETIVGVFDSEESARKYAETGDTVHFMLGLGGDQHVRLFCGVVCESHVARSCRRENGRQSLKWLEWRLLS